MNVRNFKHIGNVNTDIILECLYLLEILIQLLKKKKNAYSITYTERLTDLFFQKSAQNLFN